MSDSFMKQPLAWSSSGSMTGTSTIKSQAFYMGKFSGCSFQPVWTGTPTGSFAIYVSNDFQPSATGDQSSPANAGTWTELPGVTVTGDPAGSAGNTIIPIYAPCVYWIQIWYSNSSGSGTASGTFVGKFGG